MSISAETITENLIDAHIKSRAHLLRLLTGIDNEMWFAMPEGGRWSIQRAATHIVNAEIMWMSRKSKEEPTYFARDTKLDEFLQKQEEVSLIFRERIKEEDKSVGFLWIHPETGTPSYHWSMVRCLQHAVYHTGMISLLRQLVGAPKLDDGKNTWPKMVDSIFEAAVTESSQM